MLLLVALCLLFGCAPTPPRFVQPSTPAPASLARQTLRLQGDDADAIFARLATTIPTLGWTLVHRDADIGLLEARTPAGILLSALLDADANGLVLSASSSDAAALAVFMAQATDHLTPSPSPP